VHRDSTARGLTGPELEPDSQAATEIANLWAWLSAALEQGRGQ
jgi:hypothetical protein